MEKKWFYIISPFRIIAAFSLILTLSLFMVNDHDGYSSSIRIILILWSLVLLGLDIVLKQFITFEKPYKLLLIEIAIIILLIIILFLLFLTNIGNSVC